MQKKVIFGILAVLVLAAGAIFVIAQKARHSGGDRGGGFQGSHIRSMGGMNLRGLDLTDEQKAQADEFKNSGRSTIEPLMEQLSDNRSKIEALAVSGAFDQTQIEILAAEQGGIIAKMIVEKERSKSQIFGLLTDEQRVKASAMREKKGEHRGRGKGGEARGDRSGF